jgi:hypothetical protein
MKRLQNDTEYQQSSRDASEEDACDNDSITSIYDSTADTPHQAPKPIKKHIMPTNFDEGENSASTSADDRAMPTRSRLEEVKELILSAWQGSPLTIE